MALIGNRTRLDAGRTLPLVLAVLRDVLRIHPNWRKGPGNSIVWDTGSEQQVYWPTWTKKILSPNKKHKLRIRWYTRLLLRPVNTSYAAPSFVINTRPTVNDEEFVTYDTNYRG